MKLSVLLDKLMEINEESKKGTFKCPTCGSKVLNNTKYCVKCKKKVQPEGEGDAN
jgi:DNA-directed RNA polymerase subunit RPC12/RpoP